MLVGELTFHQTVLITGGSQGMGRALGKLLARKGANVIIVARNAAKLAEALQYISVRSIPIHVYSPRAPSDLY